MKKVTARIIAFPAPKFRPSLVPAGKCRLFCGRSTPTGSKTGICSTCLGRLSQLRNQTAGWMIRYRERTKVRNARLTEMDDYPKGYRQGRPEKLGE